LINIHSKHVTYYVCGNLDDEHHFIIESTLLKDLRKLYINTYYLKRSRMFKCIDRMTSENESVIRQLSIYVYTIVYICK